VGSSRVVVCESCKFAVARKGQDLTTIGQIADLIGTSSQLELGQTGTVEGVGFTLVGRVQLEWESGVWDEWYASFRDGRWGWVAEAQGKFYVMFKMGPRATPARGSVRVTQRLFLEGLGRYVVTDIKEAKLVCARGELPDEIEPGGTSFSVDLEGDKGTFATIDYGAQGDQVQIFVGKQVDLDGLKLGPHSDGSISTGPRPTGEKLKCPNCNGDVELRVPEQTQRVVCAYCGNLLDLTKGPLQVIQVLERYKREPALPLGSKGTVLGKAGLVVGWMRRSCTVEGSNYPWEEFLLYNEKDTSFRWLVLSDGHWSVAEPISAASVEEGVDASYKNTRFRRFSDVTGRVEKVLGEFYWQVQVGDTANLVDFIAPPNGLSKEQTAAEVNWSYDTYVTPAEVAQAFGVPRINMPPSGVGPFQPYPYEAQAQSMSHWALLGISAVVGIFLGWAVLSGSQNIFSKNFDSSELIAYDPTLDPAAGGEAPPPDAKTHTFLSQPFEIRGHQPVTVHFASNVNNGWAFVGGALINEESGESDNFSLESSYYSGVEDGESWSEGDRSASADLAAPPPGRYVLRADLQWDPQLTSPPPMQLQVNTGGVSFWQFLAALLSFSPALLIWFHRSSFEKGRWDNSNLVSQSSGDDE
jgi:hypothetical protein